jgi:hypothetical protein
MLERAPALENRIYQLGGGFGPHLYQPANNWTEYISQVNVLRTLEEIQERFNALLLEL